MQELTIGEFISEDFENSDFYYDLQRDYVEYQLESRNYLRELANIESNNRLASTYTEAADDKGPKEAPKEGESGDKVKSLGSRVIEGAKKIWNIIISVLKKIFNKLVGFFTSYEKRYETMITNLKKALDNLGELSAETKKNIADAINKGVGELMAKKGKKSSEEKPEESKAVAESVNPIELTTLHLFTEAPRKKAATTSKTLVSSLNAAGVIGINDDVTKLLDQVLMRGQSLDDFEREVAVNPIILEVPRWIADIKDKYGKNVKTLDALFAELQVKQGGNLTNIETEITAIEKLSKELSGIVGKNLKSIIKVKNVRTRFSVATVRPVLDGLKELESLIGLISSSSKWSKIILVLAKTNPFGGQLYRLHGRYVNASISIATNFQKMARKYTEATTSFMNERELLVGAGKLVTEIISKIESKGGGSATGPKVAIVTATPPGATYGIGQSVTLATTTPSATIYWTNNGTDPTTSSNEYHAPINVHKKATTTITTIKAMATAPGMSNSDVTKFRYDIRA